MAIIKLVNPTYSYSAAGIISVSVEVNLLAGDNITVLYKEAISANAHLAGQWKVELIASLIKQAKTINSDYIKAIAAVVIAYPTATSPNDALLKFIADVQAGL